MMLKKEPNPNIGLASSVEDTLNAMHNVLAPAVELLILIASTQSLAAESMAVSARLLNHLATLQQRKLLSLLSTSQSR